jgi:hypothetical protein
MSKELVVMETPDSLEIYTILKDGVDIYDKDKRAEDIIIIKMLKRC